MPNDIVDKINEELKLHNLIIEYDASYDDMDDGSTLYKLVKLK